MSEKINYEETAITMLNLIGVDKFASQERITHLSQVAQVYATLHLAEQTKRAAVAEEKFLEAFRERERLEQKTIFLNERQKIIEQMMEDWVKRGRE